MKTYDAALSLMHRAELRLEATLRAFEAGERPEAAFGAPTEDEAAELETEKREVAALERKHQEEAGPAPRRVNRLWAWRKGR